MLFLTKVLTVRNCYLQSKSIQQWVLTEKKLTIEKAYGTGHGIKEALRQATELQMSANVTADGNLQYVERGQAPPDVEPAKTTNPPCYSAARCVTSRSRVSTSVRYAVLVRNMDT